MYGEWTLVLCLLGSLSFLLFMFVQLVVYLFFYGLVYPFKKKLLFRHTIMFHSMKRLLFSRGIIFIIIALILESIGWIFHREDLKKTWGTPIDWLFEGNFSIIQGIVIVSLVLVIIFNLFDLLSTLFGINLSKRINLTVLYIHEIALSMIVVKLAYPMFFV